MNKSMKNAYDEDLNRYKGKHSLWSLNKWGRYNINTSNEFGVRTHYRIQSLNRLQDGNDQVYSDDYYQLNNWFSNRVNTDVMTDDLSGTLYLKYDNVGEAYLYTKSDEDYSPYSGIAYYKDDEGSATLSSEELWSRRFNAQHYVVGMKHVPRVNVVLNISTIVRLSTLRRVLGHL